MICLRPGKTRASIDGVRSPLSQLIRGSASQAEGLSSSKTKWGGASFWATSHALGARSAVLVSQTPSPGSPASARSHPLDLLLPDTDSCTICETLELDRDTNLIPIIADHRLSGSEDRASGLEVRGEPLSLQAVHLQRASPRHRPPSSSSATCHRHRRRNSFPIEERHALSR